MPPCIPEPWPVACDLMDRRLLQIARDTESRFSAVLPREAEAMLLIELQGESLEELRDRLEIARDELSRGTEGAFAVVRDGSTGRTRYVLGTLSTCDSATLPRQEHAVALAIYRRSVDTASSSSRCDHRHPGHLEAKPNDGNVLCQCRSRPTARPAIFGSGRSR